jgi:serine/threonine protein kinase
MSLKSISHYQITGTLGQGGMGVVYKAVDQKLQRVVAIKTLPPDQQTDEKLKKRLMSEARAASSLNHPNICTIYEVDEVDDVLLIAMEYIEGHPLTDEIKKGPIQIDRAIDIAIQAAGALDKAHRSNIIHRDIKPSNIAITDEGTVKILDFGLAQLMKHQESITEMLTNEDIRLTEIGKVAGTLPYMSPEQLKGLDLDQRSDIFSFGVVLYEMLSGQLPFRGNNPAQIIQLILTAQPELLRKTNADKIIEKALAKNRENRYSSMKDLIDDLHKIKSSQSIPQQKADLKSVAVLYFENLGAVEEQEYLRDGMTEDVITELSKVEKIRVYPRSAVIAYRDKPSSANEIGRDLNATYVLGGSIRRSGNRVRVTAHLIESDSGHTTWAERYDREMKDVFDLQDDLARAIAQALSIKLSPAEEKAISEKRIQDPKAYDFYLQGRRLWRRQTKKDLLNGVEMFEKATTLDPNLALAYAGIGHACGRIHRYYDQDVSWMKRGLEACENAMKIEPNLPEALSARAFLYYSHEQYEEAIQDAKLALDKKHDCEGAYFVLGLSLNITDHLEEAAQLTDRAIEFSGDDFNLYAAFGNTFKRLRDSERVQRLTLQHIRVLQMHLEWAPENIRARTLLAGAFADLGRVEDSVVELQTVLLNSPDDAATLINVACAYSILARKKEAIETLKKAIKNGYWHIDTIARDADFDHIRDEPEFQEIIKDAK